MAGIIARCSGECQEVGCRGCTSGSNICLALHGDLDGRLISRRKGPPESGDLPAAGSCIYTRTRQLAASLRRSGRDEAESARPRRVANESHRRVFCWRIPLWSDGREEIAQPACGATRKLQSAVALAWSRRETEKEKGFRSAKRGRAWQPLSTPPPHHARARLPDTFPCPATLSFGCKPSTFSRRTEFRARRAVENRSIPEASRKKH